MSKKKHEYEPKRRGKQIGTNEHKFNLRSSFNLKEIMSKRNRDGFYLKEIGIMRIMPAAQAHYSHYSNFF